MPLADDILHCQRALVPDLPMTSRSGRSGVQTGPSPSPSPSRRPLPPMSARRWRLVIRATTEGLAG